MLRILYDFADKLIHRQFMEVQRYLAFPGADLPVYADNATALAGGLKKNQEYRKPSGERMIVI